MYADLHIHSWYSDGTMTVDEIVEQARIRQVGLIAVTDHNQLAGSRECLQKTRGTGIRCLSGVELDAQDFGINFHILGYGVDLENGQFQAFVEANRLRLERVNELLIEKWNMPGSRSVLTNIVSFPMIGAQAAGRRCITLRRKISSPILSRAF